MAEVEDTNPALWSGPTLIGGMLMYMLYGLLLREIGTFIDYYKPGRPFHRNYGVLVTFAGLATTINLCFVTYSAWKRFVLDTHIPAHEWRPPHTLLGSSVLNGAITVTTQLFFARKVYILGRASGGRYGRVPGLIITFLSLCHLAAACSTTIILAMTNRTYKGPMRVAIAFNNATAIITDVAITGFMIILLAQYRAQSAFVSTKRLLDTITRHTIENGLAITLTVTCNIIVAYTRNDNIHESFRMVLPVLYALTVVTSLNRASAASERELSTTQPLALSGLNLSTTVALTVNGQTAGAASAAAGQGASSANVISFDRRFSSIHCQVQVERSVSGHASDGEPPLASEKRRTWDHDTASSEHAPTVRERGSKDKKDKAM